MTEKKPPIGLFPYRLWVQERAKAISAAIERYTSAGRSVPPKWLYELIHLGRCPDIESIMKLLKEIETMKCADCREPVTQAEVNTGRDIREEAGLPRTGTLCVPCAQEQIDQQEVQDFRAAFGGLCDE